MPMINRPAAAGEHAGLKKVGRYECIDQIGGDGGFETYRARVKGLAGLDRSFAVKVLRLKRSENPTTVSEPFVQAAKRSAALADPHIATVVEADPGEGLVFAATPFMEGLDLGRFLLAARAAGLLAAGKDGKTNPWHNLVAYVGAEIARGLRAAHSQKPPLIHGALCPGNVFITSRGAVALLDFGLRASIRRPFEPRPRRLLPYIAPELAAPASDSTKAGDMYTLGVLLCELASGELPPQGRRPTDTQIALSLLPEKLGLLIGRLMSFSPAARPGADDAVGFLADVYADMTEANLATDLASLVERLSNDKSEELSLEPPEAVASLADAPEEVDDAPPPPSEVEHEDVYGFEGSPGRASASPVPAQESADELVPPPELEDELSSSREHTTVGDQTLIDSLLAKSRPAVPAVSASEKGVFASAPPIPDLPAAPSIIFPPAASDSASMEPVRGPTLRGFGSTGTVALEAPPAVPPPIPEDTIGPAQEWVLTPQPEPKPRPRSSGSLPAFTPDGPISFHDEPALAALEDAPELGPPPPSVSAYDAPPATWGARALAALGNQAGISAPPSDPPVGLGLLDEALPEPPPLADPVVDYGSRPRTSQTLAIDETPIAEPAPADPVSPQEGDAPAAEFVAQDETTRGDALLEDDLVDSPDSILSETPWSKASASYGSLAGATRTPPEESLPPSEGAVLAEAMAFVESEPLPAPEAQSFLDDGGAPAAVSSYFNDAAQPEALPEPPIAKTPPPSPPLPERSSPVRRPASQQAAVPTWAHSPERQSGSKSHRRLVWVIVGSVLGASVMAGGVAGFLVGSRGKSLNTWLGRDQPAALTKPAAPAAPPLADDKGSEATAPAPSTNRVVPLAAMGKTAPAMNPTGSEKLPAPKTAAAAPVQSARAPAGVAPAPSSAKPVAPSDKTVTGRPSAASAAWGKGISDNGDSLVNVSVTSQPVGATVWINGKERGNTPVQLQVQSGPAQVVLVLAGHVSATINATAGEGTKLSKDLVAIDPPLTGEARFRAECSTQGKLPIVIDGKETGVLCPFSKLRVDPGVHKIGIFVPSLGKVREKEVTLHPGVRSIVFTD